MRALVIFTSLILSVPAWAEGALPWPWFQPPLAPAIAGGETLADDHPIARTTVALRITDQIGSLAQCSGVLIDDQVILTAAHCVLGAARIQVIFGSRVDAPVFSTWAVSASYPSKVDAYAPKERYDMALVRTLLPAPQEFAKADFLPELAVLKNGEDVTVAGYGTSRIDFFDGGILKSTELLVTDDQYSASEVLLQQTAHDAVCPGDSGGPAFVLSNDHFYLWGVANAGIGDAKPCGTAIIYADARSKTVRDRLLDVVIPLSHP